MERMNNNELLSVLAHEAGHWKKRHILKFIILTEGVALIVMYVSFRILNMDILNVFFKIEEGAFFSEVVILGFLPSPITISPSLLTEYT